MVIVKTFFHGANQKKKKKKFVLQEMRFLK